MRFLFILLLIVAFESKSTAQTDLFGTTEKDKIMLRLKKIITRYKINIDDSISEKLYYFLLELRTASIACRKDSTCDKLDCIQMMQEMKINLRKKYGENVYETYRKLTACTIPVPKRPAQTKSTKRQRISTI